MENILQEVGLTDGFMIPVANDENVELECQVKELQRKRDELLASAEDRGNRHQTIKEYFKNISKEQEENTQLLFEYDCHINTETTTGKLWENQSKGLHTEEKDLNKEIAELKKRGDHYRQESGRLVSQLEELRELVKFDQAALQTWTEAAARVDGDHAVLDHFCHVDYAKFQHLDLARQQLRQQVEHKRRKFEALNGDILSLEQSFEKLGQLYQNQQKEREGLVEQWHASAQMLHQRDENIRRAMEDVGALRTEAKQRVRTLEEHKTFYLNEQRNNKEAEMDVTCLLQELQEYTSQSQLFEVEISDLAGQLSITRGCLTSASRQVQSLRINCRRMSETVGLKRSHCLKLEQTLNVLQRQLDDANLRRMSAEDRARQLEELRSEEEAVVDRLLKENTKSQEKVRFLSEELLRLTVMEQEQRGCMTGLESSANNVKHRMQAAAVERDRQKEILYKAEMQLLEKDLQHKRMTGRADPENAEKCEQKLKELDRIMADATESNKVLLRENSRLEQECRRVIAALDLDEREQIYLRSKHGEMELQAEVGKKQVITLRAANQERQVDENVVRLRVCHLEKSLKKVGNALFSLEKQKLELEEAVKERAMEVEACLDVLSVRRRALSTQLSNLNGNINAAKLKVEHLQAKHVVSMQSLVSSDSGEAVSVTQLKIIAAQERYELQEMGDKLDTQIKTMEREITAMENTLHAVNAANSLYKCSLSRVPVDGPELQEKAALEASYYEIVEALRSKRTTLNELEETSTQLRDALQAQVEEEASLLKDAENRASEVGDMQRRLDAQTEKLNRAAREMRSLLNQLHGTQKKDYQTLEEKDMAIREIREQNQLALQQLSEVAAGVIEAAPVVVQYLRERGLALAQPSSRRSLASSRGSSVVAASSCVTIDSLTLGDVKKEENPKTRRPSILKAGGKKRTSKCNSNSKLSNTIDIVDLVVPQPK